jgi:hypothetical protein
MYVTIERDYFIVQNWVPDTCSRDLVPIEFKIEFLKFTLSKLIGNYQKMLCSSINETVERIVALTDDFEKAVRCCDTS